MHCLSEKSSSRLICPVAFSVSTVAAKDRKPPGPRSTGVAMHAMEVRCDVNDSIMIKGDPSCI